MEKKLSAAKVAAEKKRQMKNAQYASLKEKAKPKKSVQEMKEDIAKAKAEMKKQRKKKVKHPNSAVVNPVDPIEAEKE